MSAFASKEDAEGVLIIVSIVSTAHEYFFLYYSHQERNGST